MPDPVPCGSARQQWVLADRERIATALHDRLIRRLFGIGIGLESLRGRISDPELQQRLDEAVDELDASIRELRAVIFEDQCP